LEQVESAEQAQQSTGLTAAIQFLQRLLLLVAVALAAYSVMESAVVLVVAVVGEQVLQVEPELLDKETLVMEDQPHKLVVAVVDTAQRLHQKTVQTVANTVFQVVLLTMQVAVVVEQTLALVAMLWSLERVDLVVVQTV
jgi:hypothetical protein